MTLQQRTRAGSAGVVANTPDTGDLEPSGGRKAVKRHRDTRGRFLSTGTALKRFLSKCAFDPTTGCVNWVGGKTRGRGKTSRYGSFWFEGKRWTAHRWAARFIHGLEIDGLEVDHVCGNTLCVHHLQAVPGQVNREWYWIRVQVGLIEEPDLPGPESAGIPWYEPPDWFVKASRGLDNPGSRQPVCSHPQATPTAS